MRQVLLQVMGLSDRTTRMRSAGWRIMCLIHAPAGHFDTFFCAFDKHLSQNLLAEMTSPSLNNASFVAWRPHIMQGSKYLLDASVIGRTLKGLATKGDIRGSR